MSFSTVPNGKKSFWDGMALIEGLINLIFQHHRPFLVSSEDGAAGFFQTFEGRWGRMAIEVVSADGDYGDRGRTGCDKVVG